MMSDTVNVSIIIPLYNVEQYLEEGLNSILEQTLENIEVICVDDGSTDHTVEIAEKYVKKYSNIKLFRQENAGAGAARNIGISKAKGSFLAFFDADDTYACKEALETLYRKAVSNHAVICGGDLDFYFMDGVAGIDPYGIKKKYKKEGMYEYSACGHDAGWLRFIYKTDFIRNNHLGFKDYRVGQDTLFLMHTLAVAKEFYYYPVSVYRYRVGERKLDRKVKNIEDLLHMIIDALDISRVYQLTLQHQYFIHMIQENNYVPICAALHTGNKYIEELVKSVYDHIDRSLIGETDCEVLEELFDQEKTDAFLQNCINRKEEFISRQERFDTIIIYGAGRIGRELYALLKSYGMENKLLTAITKREYPEQKMNGKKVWEITELLEYRENSMVLVAVSEEKHSDIESVLWKLGYKNVYLLGQKMIGVWGLLCKENKSND